MISIYNILINSNTIIYIWGLGKTGKSILNFLFYHFPHIHCIVVDKNIFPEEYIDSFNARYISQDDFLSHISLQKLTDNEYIIPSPGVIVPNLLKKSDRIITELDLFYELWPTKIIAITGSVGKTSTTSLLYQLLKTHYSVILGGNIGIPVCDLLLDIFQNNKKIDFAILEVSNAQLELTRKFNPEYLIFTNIYDNHLDYHETFIDYFNAKKRAIVNSNAIKKIFTSYQLKKYVDSDEELVVIKDKFCFASLSYNNYYTEETLDEIYIKNGYIMRNDIFIVACSLIPPLSFIENWLLLCGILHELKICIKEMITSVDLSIPANRLEHIGKFGEIDVFNDSKATIMESVICGVNHLKNLYPQRTITVLIGGLGKGINRKDKIISLLNNNTISVVLFGRESELLYKEVNNKNITYYTTLKEAAIITMKNMRQDGIMLLAPGGSSFDEFVSYEHRGNVFKEIIKKEFF